MPGIYSSVAAFQNTTLGRALTPMASALENGLDQALIEASADCDSFTSRKLGAPATGITVTGATAGAAIFSISNCAGVYEGDILVFVVGGEVAKVSQIEPTLNFANGVYAGNVTVETPLAGNYNDGTAVSVYRESTFLVRGRRSGTGLDYGLTQAAQIAIAHAPKFGGGSYSRKIRLAQYPVKSLLSAWMTLPYGGGETAVDLSGVVLDGKLGWFRIGIGFPNPPETLWRVQYLAGFGTINPDLRDATHLYMADKIARATNPTGGNMIRNEGMMIHMTRQTASPGEIPAPLYVELAERKLAPYRNIGSR